MVFCKCRRVIHCVSRCLIPSSCTELPFKVRVRKEDSFVIGDICLQGGQKKLLTCGAVCLWKQHVNVIAMEDWARGGCKS